MLDTIVHWQFIFKQCEALECSQPKHDVGPLTSFGFLPHHGSKAPMWVFQTHHTTSRLFLDPLCVILVRSIGVLSAEICLRRKTYNYAHCSAQDVVSQRPLVVKIYVYTVVSQPPAMQMGDIMWSLRTFGLPFLSSPDAGLSEHFDGFTPTTLVRQILSQSLFWILRLNQSQTHLVVSYSWYWHPCLFKLWSLPFLSKPNQTNIIASKQMLEWPA